MKIQPNTNLCQLFNIRYPIFLAGMAGGPGTVKLAAAVSNAGGLGTIGAAYMQPNDIRSAIHEIRKLTKYPFAVNLFATSNSDHASEISEVQSELNKFRKILGIPLAKEDGITSTSIFDEQFDILIEEKVPVISTAFGLLTDNMIAQANALGIRVVSMVTSVQEALLAEQAGCDAIVAQGTEAGGHRGTFNVKDKAMGNNIGTIALVPQIVDQVNIPVIASGGIMDGRGLVAALVLGAQGVQMGTRFLTSNESGAHISYQEKLLKSTEESTVITNSFSGRPARGIKNEFIEHWENIDIEPLPFPIQNTITRDIRNAAASQNNTDYMSLWAGQGLRMLTSGQGAEEIIEEILEEARAILS
ncbi:nitronate monooxygenase [Bacillus sp. JJ664]